MAHTVDSDGVTAVRRDSSTYDAKHAALHGQAQQAGQKSGGQKGFARGLATTNKQQAVK